MEVWPSVTLLISVIENGLADGEWQLPAARGFAGRGVDGDALLPCVEGKIDDHRQDDDGGEG
jgi:hypothetical protein